MFSSMDPLAGSQWSTPSTVAGFAQSAPNAVLMAFANEELRRAETGRAAGLSQEPRVPFREYNRPQPGTLSTGTLPMIYEAAFRRT